MDRALQKRPPHPHQSSGQTSTANRCTRIINSGTAVLRSAVLQPVFYLERWYNSTKFPGIFSIRYAPAIEFVDRSSTH